MKKAYLFAFLISLPFIISSQSTTTQPVFGLGDSNTTYQEYRDSMFLYLNMAKGRKIIVERNASLIVNGGTITNECGALWKGIEVWGNSNETQNSASNGLNQFQGTVYLHNNALLSNAEVAIYSGKRIDTSPYYDVNFGGGVIRTGNATFENNVTDIEFTPFANTFPTNGTHIANLSKFDYCNFLTTNDLSQGEVPLQHVLLDNVDGINFTQCEFINSNNNSSGHEKGKGIKSIDASFKVMGSCSQPNTPCDYTNINGSRFEGLYMGIDAVAKNPMNTFMVDGANFVKNFRGIHAKGVDYLGITRTKFDIYFPSGQRYGIHLNECTGYEVENNYFSSSTAFNTAGIVIHKSGFEPNEIRNNVFNNLNVGTLVQELNRDTRPLVATGTFPPTLMLNPSPNDGLQIRCSEFSDTEYDIALTEQGEIGINQGYIQDVQSLAGNRFFSTHCGDGINRDYFFIDPALDVNYFSHNDIVPICHDAIEVNVSTPFAPEFFFGNEEQACPTTISFIDQPGPPDVGILDGLQIINDDLIAEVNGGDGILLFNAIENNMHHAQLKQLMIDASPYVSDYLLVALIEHKPAYPSSVIQQVLNANAPLSDDVLMAALTVSPYLPDAILNQVVLESTPIGNEVLKQVVFENRNLPGWMVKQILLDNSPLHDEVLLATLDNSSLPSSFIKQIFKQNTPLSQNVYDALLQRSPALPNSVIQQIQNSNVVADAPGSIEIVLSEMDKKEAEISYYQLQFKNALNDHIRYYLRNDSIDGHLDSVEKVLKLYGESEYDIDKIIAVCIKKKDLSSARIKIDDRLNDGTETNFCKLMDIILSLEENQVCCNELPPVEEPKVIDRVNEKKKGSANAQNFLDISKKERTEEIVVLPTMNKSASSPKVYFEKALTAEEKINQINSYPNPANDQVNFEFSTVSLTDVAAIKLYDMSGRLVLTEKLEQGSTFTTVKTSNWKNGTYFYEFIVNDISIKKDKFVIIK